MTGWWRARAGWFYCAVTAAAAIAASLFWPTGIMLPNLVFPRTNSFSIAYALAFVPGLTWLVVLESRRFIPETVSVRRARLIVLDCLVALATPALVMSILLCVGPPTVQGAGRNFVLAAALSMVAAEVFAERFAFLLPAGYLLVAGTMGFSLSQSVPEGWALILGRWDPERDWVVLLLAVLIAVVLRAGRERRPWKKAVTR